MPIVPDTKDWTWVLERPCPECGFDAGAFPREQVGRMVRENAATWQGVLARADGLTTRPSDDRWSALEYACHVRDVFRLYDQRLEMMLTDDDPDFPNWDQDVTAVEERYNEQDPVTVAGDITTAAARLADRFDGVPGTPGSAPATAATVPGSRWSRSPVTWSTTRCTISTTLLGALPGSTPGHREPRPRS